MKKLFLVLTATVLLAAVLMPSELALAAQNSVGRHLDKALGEAVGLVFVIVICLLGKVILDWCTVILDTDFEV